MISRAVSLLTICMVLVISAPGYAQTGPDNLWQVTTNITMDGMSLPGTPSKVCTKGKQVDRMVPMEENCKTSDVKTSGNRTTYRVTCPGKDAMSGSGEMTTGKDSYRGVLKLSGTVDGEKAAMVTEFAGKLIGKCTAK
jgi:hypothetical protein